MRIFEYGLKHAISSNFPLSDAVIARQVRHRIRTNNSDEMIADLLQSQSPVAIGRLGGTESRYIGNLIKLRTSRRKINFAHLAYAKKDLLRRQREIRSLSGFFYADEKEENQFLQIYLEAMSNLDLIGVWGQAFTWPESIALDKTNIQVVSLEGLSPWVEAVPYLNPISNILPWTSVLHGKKLLVISPFSESILAQHSKAKECFRGVDYPMFELSTIRAPMTFDGMSDLDSNWFKNLENLLNDVKEVDFDIALVGAGAYSLPLVSGIKNLGKKAIHTGGGTQLFFGIIGKRWESASYVNKYLNQDWIRPSKDEIPLSFQSIENGCYW